MIESVKIQGEGYLVNGTMSVPNSPSNRDYQEVQEWIAQGNTPEPEFTQEELDATAAKEAYRQARQAKVDAVAQIIVTTTSGNQFDGDEVAQNRMARAVAASSSGDTTQWVLADNTVATVTHDELKEALRLAGDEMTLIWVS